MMKKIPLTRNKFALVDDEDYDNLIMYTWHAVKHHRGGFIAVSSSQDKMHRVIMKTPNNLIVDHINHDTLDNRKENLRNCTASQNLANQIRRPGSKSSRYKGVIYRKDNGKWRVRISKNGIRYTFGEYECEHTAGLIYNAAAIKAFGEFARLNEIKGIALGR